MHHLIGLDQQEPVCHLDGQLLAMLLALGQQLQEPFHFLARTPLRGGPIGQDPLASAFDGGRQRAGSTGLSR